MRFISTRVHGVLDYLMGLLLIISPWLFNFAMEGPETWVPILMGAWLIAYSLFTDYELGAIRVLSMKTNLWLDAISGILLALSPWIFNFDEYVYLPHLFLGIFEFIASIITHVTPTHPVKIVNKTISHHGVA